MNKNHLARRAIFAVALLAACAAAAGCGRKPAAAVAAKPPEVFVTPAVLCEARQFGVAKIVCKSHDQMHAARLEVYLDLIAEHRR